MANLADIFRQGIPRYQAYLVAADDANMHIRMRMPFGTEIHAWRDGNKIMSRTTLYRQPASFVLLSVIVVSFVIGCIVNRTVDPEPARSIAASSFVFFSALVAGYGNTIALIRGRICQTARVHWLSRPLPPDLSMS